MSLTDRLLVEHQGVLLARELPAQRRTLERAAADGRLSKVVPGVFISPASDTFRGRVTALARALPDAVFIDTTAAALTFWPEVASAGIRLSGTRRGSQAHGISVSNRRVPPEHVIRLGPIAVARPSRTAADLCVATDGESIERALRSGAATVHDIRASLDDCDGRRGTARARRLLTAFENNPWSAGERLAHRLFAGAGLTGWTGNYPIVLNGRRRYLDMAFKAAKLAVEIDGYHHHGDRAAFEADRERQNALVLDGWTVLRFTWRMLVDSPDEVIRQVRAAL